MQLNLAKLRSTDVLAARQYLESALLNFVAPCPRSLLRLLRLPEDASRDTFINAALSQEFDAARLTSILKSCFDHTMSHALVLIRRTKVNPFHDDSFCLDFSSPYAAMLIMDHLAVLSEMDALRLFDACQGVPEASTLAGWLFERLALQYLCREPSESDGRTHTLGTMQERGTKTYWHLLEKEKNEETLLLDGFQIHIETTSKNKSLTVGKHPSTPPFPLIVKHRSRTFYSSLEEITVADTKLYIPRQRNNPLFDGFFFDIEANNAITLWVVQVTVSKLHHGSVNGYEIIRDIQKLAQGGGSRPREVQIRYLLVVPQKKDRKVTWEMPVGWTNSKFKKVQGPVHIIVKYLDWSVWKSPHINS